MKAAVQSLRKHSYSTARPQDMEYDTRNCPDHPPPGYPHTWNVLDVLDHWGVHDTTPHPTIFQGLCTFDYETEKDKALNYRIAEVPFLLRNDPQVMASVERWNLPNYLDKLFNGEKLTGYYSQNSHFMYFRRPEKGKDQLEGWKPPTKHALMTYSEWLSHANVTDDSKLGPDMEHWYLTFNPCLTVKRSCALGIILFDELPFFKPGNVLGESGDDDDTLYVVDSKEQTGIECRFGMKGVIAESHFDHTRNMIAVLGGERRYILAHPDQCENMELYPMGHPSSRHSKVDWSHPDLEAFPHFQNTQVNEVVLQAGDTLYLPTDWFHFIVSLDLNFQCNNRSGRTKDFVPILKKCGFDYDRKMKPQKKMKKKNRD